MDYEKKRKYLIAVIITCIGAAAGISYWTTFRATGGGGVVSGPVVLKCVDASCGKITEMSAKEFQDKVEQMDPAGDMTLASMGPMVYVCPHCNKRTAFIAEKCESCGEVFFPHYGDQNDYPDRCPKCGHSAMEESVQE